MYACAVGREGALQQELQRDDPAGQFSLLAPGWIYASRSAPLRAAPYVAFASQVLPDPAPLQAGSVRAWATAFVARLVDALADHAGPWRMHLFCVDIPGAALRPRRLALIEQEVVSLLKKKQRRLLRTLLRPDAPWQAGEVFVQLALHSPKSGHVSFCSEATRQLHRRVISRHVGGRVDIPEDKRPPARAYRKLLEALAHSGHGPSNGDTCVDLGASPGSWTYVALAQGAHVIALDRSPLRDDLMAHPRCEFVRGDAFKFAPASPVTWLVCDVIAFPQRSIDLLDQWLTRGDCQFFVVTLKFKGREDDACLQVCKAMLQRHGVEASMRALEANKNEVTVYSL